MASTQLRNLTNRLFHNKHQILGNNKHSLHHHKLYLSNNRTLLHKRYFLSSSSPSPSTKRSTINKNHHDLKISNNSQSNTKNDNSYYKNYKSSGGIPFLSFFKGLSKGQAFDVIFGIFSLFVTVSVSIIQEKETITYETNKEFQEKFDMVMEWLENELERKDLGDDFQQIDYSNLPTDSPKSRLFQLAITLRVSNIGHSQPQTLDNIKRVISILTELNDQEKNMCFLGVYDTLDDILVELVHDCNQVEEVIPLLGKLAMHKNIRLNGMYSISKIYRVLAKDKKYIKLLAENNAISLYMRTIFTYRVRKEAGPNYVPYEDQNAIYDIVNGIDEASLSELTNQREKEYIELCRLDANAFWANKDNQNLVKWGSAFLFSLPAVSLPLAFSVPSISAFGATYCVDFVRQKYNNSIGKRLKFDAPWQRVMRNSATLLCIPLTVIALRNYPVLFQPIVGYFFGRLYLRYELLKKTPYSIPAIHENFFERFNLKCTSSQTFKKLNNHNKINISSNNKSIKNINTNADNYYYNNYKSCGGIPFLKNANKGRLFDVIFGSISLLVCLYITNDLESQEVCKSNQEFQEKFNFAMDQFEARIRENDFNLDEIIFRKTDSRKLVLQTLYHTLVKTNIGHNQPETLDNIKRIVSALTNLNQLNDPSSFIGVYLFVDLILCQLVSDCGQEEQVLPILGALAEQKHLSYGELYHILDIYSSMSKEKKNIKLLAENNALTFFCRLYDITMAKEDVKHIPMKYFNMVDNIVKGLDETTLSNITNQREKELIQLCKQEKNSFWASKTNTDVVTWASTFLLSLPTLTLPPSISFSLPLLGAYGVTFCAKQIYDTYLESTGSAFRFDSPTLRILHTASTVFTLPLALITVRNYPMLLKPIFGYFISSYCVEQHIEKKSLYGKTLAQKTIL
ncbi:hypothetical protein CYY_008377 [Polysphondylium violaceum]|uniref:Uncharacterized protein n=1 Tax=Polysphondylium violaceum TaxID=133409 RepID=A0A8J4PQH8_9MYCE|nr:hypothetical protein CYY_008377 [Polysphondylium violaceum]